MPCLKFDVIYLNMVDFLAESANVQDMISYITEEVTGEILRKYPNCSLGERSSLRSVMDSVYNNESRQFVVIIDEWDAIFR